MERFRLHVSVFFSALLIPASAHAQKLANGSQTTAWAKYCEKATAATKEKDGKEEKKDLNICLTHHERLDDNTGMVKVSAAVREIEGQDKQRFMVMVPLGVRIQSGMRATIYPKDVWERVERNEGINENNEGSLQSLTLAYTLCHGAGCVAEVEATPDLISSLKSSGGFVVRVTGEVGTSVAFPVPLIGFAQALEGEPFDVRKPRTPSTPSTPMRCDQGFWRGCTLP
jgi:invasion protein IalB